MDWATVGMDAAKILAGVAGGWCLSRWSYRRQRRDQVADRRRDGERQRLTPLVEAVERLEPMLREVKGLIDEAAVKTDGFGPFLMNRRNRPVPTDWALDRHHEATQSALTDANTWFHRHAPELVELGLPADLRERLRELQDRLVKAYEDDKDDEYQAALLALFALVASLRDDLRQRFRPK